MVIQGPAMFIQGPAMVIQAGLLNPSAVPAEPRRASLLNHGVRPWMNTAGPWINIGWSLDEHWLVPG